MNVFNRIKVWWKSKTPVEKIYTVLGCVSTTAAVASMACNLKMQKSLKDMKVEVNLYPEKDAPPIPLKPHEENPDEGKPLTDKTEYDMSAELLKTLWKVDDLLFPEEYRSAVHQTEELMCYMEHPAQRIMDILSRADGDELYQEDLFEVQGEVEDLTRYMALRENRTEEFQETFPWLNYIPADEKKGE